MFPPASKADHKALKKAFLKTMDNKQGNDFQANQDIARLASTMTDNEINQAFAAAKDKANKENNKKNFGKDPYENVNSHSAHAAAQGAFQANDWQHAILPGLLNMLRGCGCH